jgi:exodeoxyribonuclease-3
VRLATWNVNSVKQRLPRLLPWLDERRPDVACLQETKLADAAFADLLGDELAARGYEVATQGEAAWNGVAILSRAGLDDVVAGLPGAPGFPHPEARALSATAAGSAWSASTLPTGARPARTTTATSSPGWRRCGRRWPPRQRRRSSAAT